MLNSLSIREVYLSRNTGYNTAREEYNEIFLLACSSEVEANKWVTITKWLIQKHLLALD
jgi:hypothetical protein